MTKDDIDLIYSENKNKYLYYIKSKVSDHSLSEDILHNSFLSIISLDKDKMDKIDNVDRYIYTVINNNITDFYRSGYNNYQITFSKAFDNIGYGNDIIDKIDNCYYNMDKYQSMEYTNDLMIILDKCINELNVDQRSIFMQYYLLDLTISDIANSCGINYETASSRIYYARQKIIRRLKKYLGSELKNFISPNIFKKVI